MSDPVTAFSATPVRRRALIAGITGQDGAYLAQWLLHQGYEVTGLHRRVSTPNLWRLASLGLVDHPQLLLVGCDITDLSATLRLMESVQPDEVYNLAGQSSVGASFDQPLTTLEINALGTAHLLESVRSTAPRARYVQASSSEMFGLVTKSPQDESTPFHPRSPYGISKLAAHWLTINYREAHGLHACCGILFNHESPLRGLEFVTRKISHGMAALARGEDIPLRLGNLDARRDWGHAAEYVQGLWRMLQHPEPREFVLATGHSLTVRGFLVAAARRAGFEPVSDGQATEEQLCDANTGRLLARVDPALYRPAEVDEVRGNARLAADLLGWRPTLLAEALAEEMVAADLVRATP